MTDTRFISCAWKIMDELSKSNQLDSSLERCIDIFTDETKAKSGVVWMKNKDDNRFYIVACKGDNDLTGISTIESESFIGKVFESGESLIINSNSEYEEIQKDKDLASLFENNTILVPLKTPLGILGCLQLNDSKDGFNENDQELLNNCCSLIALDIEDKGLAFSPNKNKEAILSLKGVIEPFSFFIIKNLAFSFFIISLLLFLFFSFEIYLLKSLKELKVGK